MCVTYRMVKGDWVRCGAPTPHSRDVHLLLQCILTYILENLVLIITWMRCLNMCIFMLHFCPSVLTLVQDLNRCMHVHASFLSLCINTCVRRKWGFPQLQHSISFIYVEIWQLQLLLRRWPYHFCETGKRQGTDLPISNTCFYDIERFDVNHLYIDHGKLTLVNK